MYELLLTTIALFTLWFFFGETRTSKEIDLILSQFSEEREFKFMFKYAFLFGLIVLLGNLVFWGGLIYVIFWCLQNFGVI